jgi:predicted ATPase
MTTIGQPFAGIKAACLQVCGELMYLKTQYRSRWSKIVNDLVELPELGQILQLIPDLEDCLMDDQCQSQDDKYRSALEDAQRTRRRVSASSMDDRASAKLYESFRRFTRVISSHFRPFVMVLDDLQRADNGSLQLVQSILTDTSSSGLLVVGTYRSNEVDEEHPLYRFTEELDMDSKNEGSGLAKMAQIKLSNFDEAQVKEILVVVLNLNGDETGLDALASVCYRRTLGNMFYLSRFLLTLKDDGLLQFNVALWSWQWEIESITAFSAASENVVDFMRSQLLELPTAIQKRLSMAAYLGTLFDVETEQIVWDAVRKDDEDTDNWFEMSESRGILEDCGDGLWRWAHDQVQLSARRLVQQDEIRFLKMRMARALLEGLPETKRDFYTFTIVDLLNSDEDSDVEPNLEMAILNRNATKKAASQVGLESMRHYAMAGLKYLPKNSFQNDATYKLSIVSAESRCALLHELVWANEMIILTTNLRLTFFVLFPHFLSEISRS